MNSNNNNNNNNNHNNNNNININNNQYHIKLYNLVWNNNYIRNIILNHLNIINLFYLNQITFNSLSEWEAFKLKRYLYNIQLRFPYDLELLPSNINRVLLNNYTPTSIPSRINSIGLLSFNVSYLQSSSSASPPSASSPILNNISNKVDTLHLYSNLYNSFPKIPPNAIPNSITELKIDQDLNYQLKKNVLPAGLKILSINGVKDYEKGSIPQSITQATIHISKVPFINQVSSINGLVKLSLLLQSSTDTSGIKFSNTIQHLDITCGTFNSTLPTSLKSFRLGALYFIHDIKYPSTLELLELSFGTYKYCKLKNKQIFNSDTLPSNLKSLKCPSSTLIDIKNGKSVLPDKLETLIFDFIDSDSSGKDDNNNNEPQLVINQLPSTLTYLYISNQFNQTIGVNELPSKLKILLLGSNYDKPINPLAIPSTLERLEIHNTNYNHPINLINTHPNTQIVCNNIKCYYQSDSPWIRTLCLPFSYTAPFFLLSLQNKSNLQYLDLGEEFDNEIQLQDLPTNNNIKTLVLGRKFSKTINLEHFKNLESIILNLHNSNTRYPNIITTFNNNGSYEFYSLKNIYIQSTEIIKHINPIFYSFLKFKK